MKAIVESAGAVHRAMEADWARGTCMLRSVRIRALDMTAQDAKALNNFFALTDVFMLEYMLCTEISLRYVGFAERCGPRQKALSALIAFRTSREKFLQNQDPEQAKEVVACGEAAHRAVLAATGAEMGGIGGLKCVSLERISAWMSRADAGPYLILMLARGVCAVPPKALKWAKKVLFPEIERAPRPFCMLPLTKALRRDHEAYAGVFRAAEQEYRILNAALKLPSLVSCFYAGKGSQSANEPGTLQSQQETETWDTSRSVLIAPTGH